MLFLPLRLRLRPCRLLRVRGWFFCVALGSVAGAAPATSPAAAGAPDVIYVATPQPIVEAMLKLANVQRGEVVYDLGCGDGRAVITAARDFGARGIGVDIDPQRIAESRANAVAAGVADRVAFRQADLFQMAFADADVLFLYLLPELNVRLRPRILNELRPGSRVISHAFTMDDWVPDRIARVGNIPIFFWIVPARVAGEWTVSFPGGEQGSLSLQQEYQVVTGSLTLGRRTVLLRDVQLSGATLMFSYASGWSRRQAIATVTEGRLTGTLEQNWRGRIEPWTGVRK